MSATPRPWKQKVLIVADQTGNTVAHCTRWDGDTPQPGVAEANARLIVTAVNAHEDLLAAARDAALLLAELGSTGPTYQSLRAAISKASPSPAGGGE